MTDFFSRSFFDHSRSILLNVLLFSVLGTLFFLPGAAPVSTPLTLLSVVVAMSSTDTRNAFVDLFSNRESRWIAWPFFLWFLAAAFIASCFPAGLFRDFPHLQLRFLAALSLLALSRVSEPRPGCFFWSLPIAATLAALHACYSILIEDLPRAQAWGEQGMNPIYFGNWSMVVAALLVLASALATSLRSSTRVGLLAAGVLAAGASIASGSRSSALALIVLLPLILLLRKDKFHRNLVTIGLVFGLLGSLAIIQSPTLQRHLRWDGVMHDITELQNNNHATSIGTRLAIWQAAWKIFQDHPLLGIGPRGFKAEYIRLMEEGEVPNAVIHAQAHSDLLQAMATGGAIGLVSYLGVIVGPLIFFGLALRRAGAEQNQRLYAACGLLVTGATFMLNLTNANFVSRISSMTYPLLICAIAALLLRDTAKKSTHADSRKYHA